MNRTEILEELRRMPEAERRELVETIELEFGDFDDALTPGQAAELDRRAEEFRKNPRAGIPFEQARTLPLADQIDLCRNLLEGVVESHELTPGEAELIDERVKDHLAKPDDIVSLAEVKAKLDTKY